MLIWLTVDDVLPYNCIFYQIFQFITNSAHKANDYFYLDCRSVSWVRLSDGHILTVDSETFTQDSRISSNNNKITNVWSLR